MNSFVRSTYPPVLAAIRASSRARFAAASLGNPPTHRGLLTPRTSATRITYDHDFPRRITPFRNLGAGTPEAPVGGLTGRQR